MATQLAKAYVQIIPSAQGIKGKLTQALGGESEASAAGQTVGQSVGTSLVSKIKTVIAAAGIGKALAASVTEGAALEQSIGGIETLFGDSADKVIQNAQRAYKTAGLSANAYMENVTGFSAALLQGLGGDTEKAAGIADMAMTDMSDNANKFGSDMESIQNAYLSFSRGQYQLLDNLKLGYGGTQAEMKRLLQDAQEISGVEYDISNLSDVYSAIHVIQKKLDITETTSKEAATTISGSFAAMKAAAQNVLGYLATGMDVGPAVTALVETAATFLRGNLIPAIGNIITGLPKALMAVIPEAGAGIALELVDSLSGGWSQQIPEFLGQALPFLVSLSESLLANASILIDAGLNLLSNLASGFINSSPILIEYVPTIITNIANIINNNAPKLVLTAAALLVQLGIGLIKAIPTLIKNVPQIITAIVAVFNAFNWLNLGKTIMTALKNGITSMVGATGGSAQQVLNSITKVIQQLPGKMVTFAKKAFSQFKSAFLGSGWTSVGSQVLQGIWNGINNKVSWLKSKVTGVVNKIKGWFTGKSGFDEHSPSKWANKVFRYVMEGGEEGLQAGMPGMMRNVNSVVGQVREGFAKSPGSVELPGLIGMHDNSKHIRDAYQQIKRFAGADFSTTETDLTLENLSQKMDLLAEVLEEYLPYLPKLAELSIVLDTGKTVGALVAPIDEKLGSIHQRKARGTV